jgi:glucose-6-phosphate 1-epimerase
MRDDDYKRFICVEAAAAVNPITLLPGESWNGAQRLEAGH